MPTWTDNDGNRCPTLASVVLVTYFKRRGISALLDTAQIPGNLTAFSAQTTNGDFPGEVQTGKARVGSAAREFHLVFGKLAIEGKVISLPWRQLNQRVRRCNYNDWLSISTHSLRALLIETKAWQADREN